MNKKINKDILKLDRIVYCGFSKDEEILRLAKKCKKENKVLVAIVATTKNYSMPLQKAISILDDRIWVYELSLGMMVNLESKGRLYCELNKGAKLAND